MVCHAAPDLLFRGKRLRVPLSFVWSLFSWQSTVCAFVFLLCPKHNIFIASFFAIVNAFYAHYLRYKVLHAVLLLLLCQFCAFHCTHIQRFFPDFCKPTADNGRIAQDYPPVFIIVHLSAVMHKCADGFLGKKTQGGNPAMSFRPAAVYLVLFTDFLHK